MSGKIITMAVLSFLLLSGCLAGNKENTNEITISAAISLSSAFRDIGEAFQTEHPDVRLYFNFGASGTLMRQIEQGAEVDVFASASRKEMDSLDAKGLIITPTRTNFSKNRLVIIAPSLLEPGKLLNPDVERIAIGNPKTVPAGYYAKTFLLNTGLYDTIKPKLVFAENVRQVMNYVELGAVDAGFVYLSDTHDSGFTVSAVNDSLYPEIIYPVAVIQGSDNTDTAKEFIKYVLSDKGQTILHKHGFV